MLAADPRPMLVFIVWGVILCFLCFAVGIMLGYDERKRQERREKDALSQDDSQAEILNPHTSGDTEKGPQNGVDN